jgi:tRNA-dihydrouridine synthase
MVAAVSVPVTVKIRSGLKRVTAPALAGKLAAVGAAAVCVHPRLADQGQRGRADHSVTEALVDQLDIPVIASGDVGGPDDAERLLGAGCAAVMIGRAALGNPWVFEDLLAGVGPYRRSVSEVLAEMARFYCDLEDEITEQRANRAMRKFYGWYLAPFKPGAELRDGLRRIESFAEAEKLIRGTLPG